MKSCVERRKSFKIILLIGNFCYWKLDFEKVSVILTISPHNTYKKTFFMLRNKFAKWIIFCFFFLTSLPFGFYLIPNDFNILTRYNFCAAVLKCNVFSVPPNIKFDSWNHMRLNFLNFFCSFLAFTLLRCFCKAFSLFIFYLIFSNIFWWQVDALKTWKHK